MADASKSYTLPLGTVIWPHGYLLLFRTQTHLSLGDYGDRVALLRPDGAVADEFTYIQGPGNDRSYCRSVDGTGTWTRECAVTPGETNRPLPTPTPRQTSAPGEDDPTLHMGDRVQASGRLEDYHGELELAVAQPSDLARLSSGVPPAPLRVKTAEIGERHEGRLVWVSGQAKFESGAIIVDDGSGPARVYFADELPWRRPYVRGGDVWMAASVVSQYVAARPYTGGYQLLPRLATDFSQSPLFLPVTEVSEVCQQSAPVLE